MEIGNVKLTNYNGEQPALVFGDNGRQDYYITEKDGIVDVVANALTLNGQPISGSGGTPTVSTLQDVLNEGSSSTGSGVSIDCKETEDSITFKAGLGTLGDGWLSYLRMTNTALIEAKSYDMNIDKYSSLYVNNEESIFMGRTFYGGNWDNAIYADGTGVNLKSTHDDNYTFVQLRLDAASGTDLALFTDGRVVPLGLQYAGNYTASFTDRSLVDKGYVDSKITTTLSKKYVAQLTQYGTGNPSVVHTFENTFATAFTYQRSDVGTYSYTGSISNPNNQYIDVRLAENQSQVRVSVCGTNPAMIKTYLDGTLADGLLAGALITVYEKI